MDCIFAISNILLFNFAGSSNTLFLGAKIMKKIAILLLFLSMTSPMLGKISTRVCEADGNTPFDGRDIMVGTKLTLITSSDTNAPWDMGGGLFIAEAYWDYGILSGRDYNEATGGWDGSRYPAAGIDANVWSWEENGLGIGFMFAGAVLTMAGDRFIIDYNASEVGDCIVDFYDFDVDEFFPVDSFTFHQILTPDFTNDTKVDFSDYAILASQWLKTDCSDPGWCQGTDLNTDGNIDYNDLRLFCEYWLEKTE